MIKIKGTQINNSLFVSLCAMAGAKIAFYALTFTEAHEVNHESEH